MNPLLIHLNVIIVFLISVQYSNSLNVYVLDTKGHIAKLNEPIHLNEDQTPKHMRDRFKKQLAEFLISKKQPQKNRKRVFKTNKVSHLDSSQPKASLVVFSNGRYVLDLDKLDFKEALNESIVNKTDCEYFDSEECIQDYYENMNNSPDSVDLPVKSLSKNPDSSRKNNQKSNVDQYLSSPEYVAILRHGKKIIMKRFKIMNNSSKKKKKKKVWSSNSDSSHSSEEIPRKTKKKYYKSSYERDSSTEIHGSLSEEKKKYSSEISPEEDDDEVYLQGNQLIPLKYKNDYDEVKRSYRQNPDGRRRLPHFLPKRFHWNPDEIQHLGYFWFNGPKGRYPEAVPL